MNQLKDKMMNELEKRKYERAKKRVHQIKGFYTHAGVYFVVNTFIIVSNYLRSDGIGDFWDFGSFSALIFWGIGLAAHGLGVFGVPFVMGNDWEERQIKKIMDRDRNGLG